RGVVGVLTWDGAGEFAYLDRLAAHRQTAQREASPRRIGSGPVRTVPPRASAPARPLPGARGRHSRPLAFADTHVPGVHSKGAVDVKVSRGEQDSVASAGGGWENQPGRPERGRPEVGDGGHTEERRGTVPRARPRRPPARPAFGAG